MAIQPGGGSGSNSALNVQGGTPVPQTQNQIPVPNGETPLASLPQYGGSGGDTTSAQYYAGQQFAKTFGRNPTQQELDQLTPAFIDPNGHVANLSAGNAAVANYYQQQANSP